MKKKKLQLQSKFWRQNKALDRHSKAAFSTALCDPGRCIKVWLMEWWSGRRGTDPLLKASFSSILSLTQRKPPYKIAYSQWSTSWSDFFLSIWSLSQIANLGILTQYLFNKTIWPFPSHLEDFVQIWLYCKVADLRIAEVRMQRVVKLRLAPSPSLKDKYFYSHCTWWGQETVGPNHIFHKIRCP